MSTATNVSFRGIHRETCKCRQCEMETDIHYFYYWCIFKMKNKFLLTVKHDHYQCVVWCMMIEIRCIWRDLYSKKLCFKGKLLSIGCIHNRDFISYPYIIKKKYCLYKYWEGFNILLFIIPMLLYKYSGMS